MSDDKIDPSRKDSTISSADDLVKTGDAELTEEQLNRVTGGGGKTTTTAATKDKVETYLTYELTNTNISG